MDVVDIAAELKYWEARATTAEMKVKEWSVRACEADERIAKAREILKEAVKRECYTFETSYYYDEIKSAIAALEGK